MLWNIFRQAVANSLAPSYFLAHYDDIKTNKRDLHIDNKKTKKNRGAYQVEIGTLCSSKTLLALIGESILELCLSLKSTQRGENQNRAKR